jgi:hypothetical protein
MKNKTMQNICFVCNLLTCVVAWLLVDDEINPNSLQYQEVNTEA